MATQTYPHWHTYLPTHFKDLDTDTNLHTHISAHTLTYNHLHTHTFLDSCIKGTNNISRPSGPAAGKRFTINYCYGTWPPQGAPGFAARIFYFIRSIFEKKRKTDKFKIFKCLKSWNKTFQKEIFSNKDCRQNSKRIYAAKLSRNFRKDLCWKNVYKF